MRYVVCILVCVAAPALAGQGSQPSDCPTIAGADAILSAGSVVLLGEIHGTAQAPEATRHLACRALALGAHVTVGLELPQEEQTPINEYLDSSDGREARAKLLSGSFWQRNYQDGRTSEAMFELLIALRQLRASADGLRVAVIDNPASGRERDTYMAKRVAEEIASSPDDVFIVLTGNLHNRLTVGTPFNAELEPMGYLLRRQLGQLSPSGNLVSLRITHSGGDAWICTSGEATDCGIRELDAQETETAPPGIELSAEGAYSGRYHVGRITASPPAKTAPID